MNKKRLSFLDKLLNRRGNPAAPSAGNNADTTLSRAANKPAQPPAIELSPAEREAFADRDRRHAAARERLSDAGRADWPPVYADPFPHHIDTLPEIRAVDLSVDVVSGAVAHHGVLLVRGLLDAGQVAEIRAVQELIKAASLRDPPYRSGWYKPFAGKSQHENALRQRTQSRGGNWLADSPLGLAAVMRILEAVGVIGIFGQHFQERPAISLQKSTLRSVQPDPTPAGWHQDGSFLGDDVRSMNVWIALSPCGGSLPASGIELIPHRFEEIIPPRPELGIATIPFDVIDDIRKIHPSVLPEFAAGDALIFDEHLVHRTSFLPELRDVRYALECWFFAPSHNSPNYVPFLV